MMREIVLLLCAAMLMEPASAVMHRWVMHGFGWGWHRSHHQRLASRFEKNDLYPLCMAAATVLFMLAGTITGLADMVFIGGGITLYGALYFLVHDVLLHRRLPAPRALLESSYVQHLARAHGIHHLFGKAPYGFLAPVVPRELRARSEERRRDPRAAL